MATNPYKPPRSNLQKDRRAQNPDDAEIEDNLSRIKSKLTLTLIIGFLGPLLGGLGLYGIFAAKGNAFHPFLNKPENCYGFLAAGIVIAAWHRIQVTKLKRQEAELTTKSTKSRGA